MDFEELYLKRKCFSEKHEKLVSKISYAVWLKNEFKAYFKAGKEEVKKRCEKYEQRISAMEKGICDVCKESEND